MIVTIQSIKQEFTKNGDEFLKVQCATADGRETTKSVFSNLKEKWGLLQEDATLEFAMEKKGQFWNVIDIKPVSEQIPDQDKDVATEAKRLDKKMPEFDEMRNRSMAISYAKDAWIAGKIEKKDLYLCADYFLSYIKNTKGG